MAGAHNIGTELHNANGSATKDPGASGTITVTKSLSVCNLVSAAAETRTLARPTKQGVIITLHHFTDGGDITLTVTGGYNESGATTIVLQDVGQYVTFQSFVTSAGVYFWRRMASDGVILTGASIVNVTAANLTLTPQDHGNKTVTINRATGCVIVLPAATGSGVKYRIVIGTTITTTSVVTVTGVGLYGQIYQLADGGATLAAYELAASTVITLGTNANSTGGVIGDSLEFEDIGSGQWWCVGHTSAAGTEATPVT